MSRIIKCDRCGGEVDPKRIGYVSMSERGPDGELIGEYLFDDMDFCENCMEQIAAFVTKETATREAKTRKGETVDKVKRVSRKSLDIGKICALAKAGWTQEKIADEMGCSKLTIHRILKETKETKE